MINIQEFSNLVLFSDTKSGAQIIFYDTPKGYKFKSSTTFIDHLEIRWDEYTREEMTEFVNKYI